MMFSLENKLIVVTGAASGLGKETAKMLASQGGNICLLDIDEANLLITQKEIESKGLKSRHFVCDITKPDDIHKTFELIGNIGNIDVLVNVAGVSHVDTIETAEIESFSRIYDINVKGLFLCCQASIPFMKKNELGGAIINICSIASTIGIQDRFSYTASKGAVHSLTLSMAADLAKYKIRCNTISPTRMHTKLLDNIIQKNYPHNYEEMLQYYHSLQPLGRMAYPEELAAMVCYLASNEAFIITGSNFIVDGGFSNLK